MRGVGAGLYGAVVATSGWLLAGYLEVRVDNPWWSFGVLGVTMALVVFGAEGEE